MIIATITITIIITMTKMKKKKNTILSNGTKTMMMILPIVIPRMTVTMITKKNVNYSSRE